MEFFADYLGEIILLIGIAVLRLFGKNESADKLEKKRLKYRKKLEKKVQKESTQLEKDLEKLKEV